jgi:tetraacyldisaccharide 4'-kinase
LRYSDIEDQNGNPVDREVLREAPFTLVTGIARPGPLLAEIKREGFDFEHLSFPDHHSFDQAELRRLKAIPRLLTTEKDAVRLREDLDSFWCIRVAHQFGPEDLKVVEEFLSQF